MKIRTRQFASVVLCMGIVAPAAPHGDGAQRRGRGGAEQTGPAGAREEAYRANNLGVALLEQFRHADGAEQFRRALRLDPQLALARINLAVALFNVPEAEEARRGAEAAAALAPRAPHPHYILGLIARAQNRPDDALASFPPPSGSMPRVRRAPFAARDEHGHDVLARLAHIDRRYPDDFALHRLRGYAEEHALTLDLGPVDAATRTLLLLTGWTDYAFSSDNVAAAQSGMKLRPPALQVKNAHGHWQTVIENIGLPVGRPQTVVVDLTDKLPAGAREVRVVTNMRVYWDQILVDTSGGDFPTKMTTLEPASAELRWRGFSAEQSSDGREPFSYDYTRVSHTSPWKVMPGRYTREGDVLPLLLGGVDDMFVVARPGDEAAVSFDASLLPALPPGWARTFLIHADGFSKEMDLNSASPDQVAPLPFHGMRNYPYGADESYPATPAHRDYVERYNTRVVTAPLSRMAAIR